MGKDKPTLPVSWLSRQLLRHGDRPHMQKAWLAAGVSHSPLGSFRGHPTSIVHEQQLQSTDGLRHLGGHKQLGRQGDWLLLDRLLKGTWPPTTVSLILFSLDLTGIALQAQPVRNQ